MEQMLTMMIVDDRSIDRAILRGIFLSEYNIVEADDGDEALKLLKSGVHVDIILLDIFMPKMNGFDFLRAIKKEEAFKDIAVVVNTESDDEDNEVEALELGADDFITKPYNQRIVKKRISNVVNKVIFTQVKMSYQTDTLRFVTQRDVLTGLYNRECFYKEAREFISGADSTCVIAVWNVDRFKVVNELFGSRLGDQVLRNIAHELVDLLKNNGICTRTEADRFVFCTTREYLDEIMPKVDRVLTGQDHRSPIDYTLQLHMGIYEVIDPDMPVYLMCDRADMALQTIKDSYLVRCAYYSEKLKEDILNEQELVIEMEQALNNKQFFVVFQPIVDTKTGLTVSAEALIRWKHPIKGIINPGIFVPLCEKNGFIAVLDLYVCEEVCRFQREQLDKGVRIVPISINISRINFYRTEFSVKIKEMLDRYKLEPTCIKLEITEGAYQDNPKYMAQAIKDFKASSFQILMDDFGSGYSSLNMLKDFNVDILKIDMKFIDDLETSERADNILYSIIQMARALDMGTVAEGVETKAQYELLASMGCDCIQGYYFSKPISKEEFTSRLEFERERNCVPELPDVRRTILIVDDQQIDRKIISHMMQEEYHVLEATNGEEAFELLKNNFNSISLIIADIHMPKMNGLMLLEKKAEYLYLKEIPVIMITSSGERECEEQALERGALEIITKPYDSSLVRKRISNVLKLSETGNMMRQIQRLHEGYQEEHLK
ncbi:MAG: EAL domain-containing protein [Lachnospiraceae bacterium]|nr:EAL domain-containing protein [Lachnospiraceae bacterium]